MLFSPKSLTFHRILLDVTLEVRRNVGIDINRGDGTLRLAKTTVNALVRVNVDHVFGFVDTIHGADGHAGLVLDTNASFGYDIRHF